MQKQLTNIVEAYPGMPADFYYKVVLKNMKDVTPLMFIELGRIIGEMQAAKKLASEIQTITNLWQRQN